VKGWGRRKVDGSGLDRYSDRRSYRDEFNRRISAAARDSTLHNPLSLLATRCADGALSRKPYRKVFRRC
jgi:hypothetical protein